MTDKVQTQDYIQQLRHLLPEPGGYFDIQQLTKAVYTLMMVALEQNEQLVELRRRMNECEGEK